MKGEKVAFLRTLLVLGRASNLPTVWSNCLAGWWLGGAGNVEKLPYLLIGATALYTGGMFLNDAFDVGFDQQYRKERPIPAGAIELKTVWIWGIGWLALGVFCLAWVGAITGLFSIALAGCIVLYDALHKRVSFAPVLMGLCRFVLYLAAGSVAVNGLNLRVVGCAGALFAYIVGLSYVARRESVPTVKVQEKATGEGDRETVKTVDVGSGHGPTPLKRGVNENSQSVPGPIPNAAPIRYWPILLVAMPVVVALIFNRGSQLEGALLVSAIFAVWTVRSLRYTLWTEAPNIGRTVSGLLAGIVWVDLVAVANAPREFGAVFVGLFLAALLFQKFVPAT